MLHDDFNILFLTRLFEYSIKIDNTIRPNGITNIGVMQFNFNKPSVALVQTVDPKVKSFFDIRLIWDFGLGSSAKHLIRYLDLKDRGFHRFELFSVFVELSSSDSDLQVADFCLAFFDCTEIVALAWGAAHFRSLEKIIFLWV